MNFQFALVNNNSKGINNWEVVFHSPGVVTCEDTCHCHNYNKPNKLLNFASYVTRTATNSAARCMIYYSHLSRYL